MIVAPVLIVLAACAAYANTFRVPFLFDDAQTITGNASIKDLWRVGKVLSSGAAITADRPLLNLSFALNYAWTGQRVWSYHLVNLAIHIFAALTLFGIVRRTLSSRVRENAEGSRIRKNADEDRSLTTSATWLAFTVALIWTVHPLQSESVTYISQRAESLMGLFYLLTLYCFIRSTTSFRPLAWRCLSIAACFCGMATKETMVTAPLVVLLYDRAVWSGSFREAAARNRRYYMSLCSAWIFLGFLMRGGALGMAAVGFHLGVSWQVYARSELKAVAEYVKLSLWPHPLVFDYGKEMLVNSPSQAAPYALFFAVLAIAAVFAWRASKPLGFLAVSFFILLSPTSSVVPIAVQPMAESRMYLPLAAVIALVALAGNAWAGRKALAVLIAAAIALGALTFSRNHDYQSPVGLWEDTVAKRPDSSRGQYNLANELAKVPGRLPEAVDHYEQALRIDPNYDSAHNNLANELARIPGRLPEALEHYERALRIDPRNASAHNNYATELTRIPGRLPEALEHFEQALRIDPNYAVAHNNFANALSTIPGRLPEAVDHYQQALRIDPSYAAAHNNLANALAKIPGRLPEAIEHYEQALRIDPDFSAAHNNLGNALYRSGRFAEAIDEYRQAIHLQPDYAEARNSLGNALFQIGQLPEAIDAYREAIRLRPDLAEARNGLGNTLFHAGKLPEATDQLRQAVRLQPNYVEARDNLGVVLSESGNNDEAIGQYRQVLRLKPDYAEAHNNLGIALYRAGRISEAIGQYRQALRLGLNLPEVHYNLGLALEKAGNSGDAVSQFQEALRLKPGYHDARRDLERLQAAH